MELARYREWLLEQGLSPKTVTIYEAKVSQAEAIASAQGWDLRTLTAHQASTLGESFQLTASTRRQLRTALVHYWAMNDVDRPPAKAIRVPPKPRGHYRGLEPDEAQILAKMALDWWPDGAGVLLGMYLGLRREEIATLRWDRFDPQMEWVTIIGKRDRTRVLPVHPVIADQIRSHMSPFVWVFPGIAGREYINPATVGIWSKRVSDAAGIREVAPHMLRHTCLATMNDATGDLRTTQEFAGHARPETTAIYTRTTAQRMTSAVMALDYLDDTRSDPPRLGRAAGI